MRTKMHVTISLWYSLLTVMSTSLIQMVDGCSTGGPNPDCVNDQDNCGNYAKTPEYQGYLEKCGNNLEGTAYMERLEKELEKNGNCAAIMDPTSIVEIEKLITNGEKYLVDGDGDIIGFLQWLKNVPQSSYTNICVEYRKLNACVMDGLLPIVQEALDSTTCCDKLQDLTTVNGILLKDRIEMILDSVHDLMCLNRTPLKPVLEIQNCGYSIIQSMFPPELDQISINIKKLVQIPNDQACKAFSGEQYTDTMNKPRLLTPFLPIGNCSRAFDTVFSTLKDYLFDDKLDELLGSPRDMIGDETSQDVKDLFTEGKCLQIDEDAIPIEEIAGELCLHLPTGFSDDCFLTSEESSVTLKKVNDDGEINSVPSITPNPNPKVNDDGEINSVPSITPNPNPKVNDDGGINSVPSITPRGGGILGSTLRFLTSLFTVFIFSMM